MEIPRGLKAYDVQVQKVTMQHSHGKEQDLNFICRHAHKTAFADSLTSNIKDKIIIHTLELNGKVLLSPGIFNIFHISQPKKHKSSVVNQAPTETKTLSMGFQACGFKHGVSSMGFQAS